MTQLSLRVGGILGYHGVPLSLSLQTGGRDVPGWSRTRIMEEYNPNNGTGYKRIGKKLEQVYNSFVNRLKTHKKTLSENTKTQVKKMLDGLVKAERNLVQILGFIEAYTLLTEMNIDTKKEIVTSDMLKEAKTKYEKSHKKVGKKRSEILSVLEALFGIVKENESSETEKRDMALDPELIKNN